MAIADFAVDDAHGRALAEVIRADLTRTGQFRLISAAGAGLNVDSAISHDDWRSKGADFLAYGSIVRGADGRYDVRYRLADTVKKGQLDGVAFSGTEQELRRVAHQIADRIYEKITGVRGVFSTRIAYVLKQGPTYELQVADADGQNPQVALRSREPIISPSWSPDGSKLAYVSFESGKPVVYVHTLATSARVPVANFKGNNSAPGWSPDGTQLAVALTRDGLSQIYIVSAAGGSNMRRVTRSPGLTPSRALRQTAVPLSLPVTAAAGRKSIRPAWTVAMLAASRLMVVTTSHPEFPRWIDVAVRCKTRRRVSNRLVEPVLRLRILAD